MLRCLCLTLCLAMAGTATAAKPAAAAAQSPFVGLFAPYKDCREKYAAIDARIDKAGVRDGAYYRVPG